MQPRVQQLALVGLGIAVLAGLAMLVLGITSEPSIEVDETELARAKAAHQRGQGPPAAKARSLTPVARTKAAEPSEPLSDEQDVFKAAKKPPAIPQPPSRTATTTGLKMSPGAEDFVAAMDGANTLYDRGDYEGAVEAAEELLDVQPNNVRILRIAVSSHCILGNAEPAKKFHARLPSRDKRQMTRRCSRYGIEFDSE